MNVGDNYNRPKVLPLFSYNVKGGRRTRTIIVINKYVKKKLPSLAGMQELVHARHEEAIRRDPRTGEDMVRR